LNVLKLAAFAAVLSFVLLATATPARGETTKRRPPIVVYAGPPSMARFLRVNLQADAPAFFPANVTIRAGQSITWRIHGFHTITFPGANTNLPLVVPHPELPQPPLSDAARVPFWWVGNSPQLEINPSLVEQRGRATVSNPTDFRNSGIVRLLSESNGEAAPYTLTFLKPGIYHYFCAIHLGMRGTVTVLPASAKRTTQATVSRQAKAQIAKVVAELKRLNTTAPTDRNRILVGAGRSGSAEIMSFFPSRLNINVGDTVTFVDNNPTDVHTVTFGPEEYTSAIENSVFEYAGDSLVFNPLSALPSEPPDSPSPVRSDGTNHGNGYINSGLLYPPQTPDQLHQFAVTFTNAGTYRLECVIHSNMDATIVVR
jgi:plastocyanin